MGSTLRFVLLVFGLSAGGAALVLCVRARTEAYAFSRCVDAVGEPEQCAVGLNRLFR